MYTQIYVYTYMHVSNSLYKKPLGIQKSHWIDDLKTYWATKNPLGLKSRRGDKKP